MYLVAVAVLVLEGAELGLSTKTLSASFSHISITLSACGNHVSHCGHVVLFAASGKLLEMTFSIRILCLSNWPISLRRR